MTTADPDLPTRESHTQRAYLALREMILSVEVAPGQRLKIDTLKTRINAGASPIREALSLLTSDQLVERVDQRGFRVAPVSAVQFAEILKLRCQLEPMALRDSISHASQSWEEDLVLTHHRLTRTPRDQIAAFEVHHKAFHMALLAQCPSPILRRYCDQLYDLNIRYRRLAGQSGSYTQRDVAREHADILAAALDRDATLAGERLTGHYSVTGQFLAGQFEGNRPETE